MKTLMPEKIGKKETVLTPFEPLKSGKKRGQLIEAATRVFAQKGFNGATTKEIAQQAVMSEANIFRYFASKDALYAAVFEEKARALNITAALRKLRRLAAAGDDAAVFRELMMFILNHHRRNRDLMRMILFGTLEGNRTAGNFANRHLSALREFLTCYIDERQRAGVFRECSARAAVRALLAMPSQHAMMTELFGADNYEVPDAEAVETFAQTALDALRIERGR